MIEAVLIIK